MCLFAESLHYLHVTYVKHLKLYLYVKNLVLPLCDSFSPLVCYMQ